MYLASFVASPLFRGVGVGFEEPHLRLMLWFVESGFHEFPIILHVRLIRVGWCYDTALKEAESPVITWVQVLGSFF